MVKSCCAYGCRERQIAKSGISFHKFPIDAVRRKKWIIAIKRQDFEPTDHMRICSKHFIESDFETHLGRRKLKANAVPSLFDFQRDRTTRNKRTDARDEPHTVRISPEKNATIKGLLEPKPSNKAEVQNTKPLITLNDHIEELLKSEVQHFNTAGDLKPVYVIVDENTEQLKETEAISANLTNFKSPGSPQPTYLDKPQISLEENSMIKMESDMEVQYEEDIKPVFLNECIEKQSENASVDKKPDLTVNEDNDPSTTVQISSEESCTIKTESDLLEALYCNHLEVHSLHHEEDIKPSFLNECIKEQPDNGAEVQNFESTDNLEPVSIVNEEIKESKNPKLIKIRKIVRQTQNFGHFEEQDLKSEEAKKIWRVANKQISKQRSTIKILRIRNTRLMKKVALLESLVTCLKSENKVS